MSRRRIAAIDVGSNTLHLLVVEVAPDGGLSELCREVRMPRLGETVQTTGSVGAAKLAEVVAEVARMAATARALGADPVLLGATEAVRRAADRDAVLAAVGAAAAAPCLLVSPAAEARLSFRGVDGAHPGEGIHLVADIGGGSTECILGESGQVRALASVPVGSGSATQTWLTSDPPTEAERQACAAGVRAALAAAPAGAPARGSVTGGTANSLPVLLGRAEGSGSLDAADLERCRSALAAHASAELARRHDLEEARARVLAGGVEVVAAVRERYRLERLTVSAQGLRDGMVRAYLERGEDWPRG